METSENIKSYYQDYISIYKDETDRLKQFKTFIDKTESDQLFDRKNFAAILPAVRLFLITKIPKYF